MKFHFWVDDMHSYIAAEFESTDARSGKREEGAGTEITLQDQILKYDYRVIDIHPDILGLICMINFFPFIGDSVTFPKPVSRRLVDAFSTQPFVSKKKINFTNVSDDIEKYSGKNLSIVFGGGVDSTAVRLMFPEALCVHESHIRNYQKVSQASDEIVRSFDDGKGVVVNSNQRYVSIPGGWHSWPASAVSALLMATDKGTGLLLTGTVQAANWLWNGVRFYDRHKHREIQGFSGNHWQSVFYEIGIPMFSPIDGVSEFGNMSIAIGEVKEGRVIYCTANSGQHCNRCTKCFRKALLRQFFDEDWQHDFESYNRPDIHEYLARRPLYMGHIFSFLKKKGKMPKWSSEHLRGLRKVESDWPLNYYEPALDFCPEDWRDLLEGRIQKSFKMMSKEESEEFVSWIQD